MLKHCQNSNSYGRMAWNGCTLWVPNRKTVLWKHEKTLFKIKYTNHTVNKKQVLVAEVSTLSLEQHRMHSGHHKGNVELE